MVASGLEQREPMLRKEPQYGWRRLIAPVLVAAAVIVSLGIALPRSNLSNHAAQTLAASPIRTTNPIIGVHSHQDPEFGDEFIAASYIKWIESAGGRAVRIPWNAPEDELTRLLSSVNGVLFPGGDPDPSPAAAFVYARALELNRNGTHFPLWGTCLGFEWMLQLQTGNLKILDNVDAQNLSSTLNLVQPGQSRLFSFSPFFTVLTTEPITDNFHHFGILADHFAATPALTSFYKVLATSQDRQGATYVAAIEAVDAPFYGVQFHPEKNPYEFGRSADGTSYESIDHRYAAIMTSQAFAHFFISEARKNSHAFPTPADEQAALLYNSPRSNRSYPMYEEVFVFATE